MNDVLMDLALHHRMCGDGSYDGALAKRAADEVERLRATLAAIRVEAVKAKFGGAGSVIGLCDDALSAGERALKEEGAGEVKRWRMYLGARYVNGALQEEYDGRMLSSGHPVVVSWEDYDARDFECRRLAARVADLSGALGAIWLEAVKAKRGGDYVLGAQWVIGVCDEALRDARFLPRERSVSELDAHDARGLIEELQRENAALAAELAAVFTEIGDKVNSALSQHPDCETQRRRNEGRSPADVRILVESLTYHFRDTIANCDRLRAALEEDRVQFYEMWAQTKKYDFNLADRAMNRAKLIGETLLNVDQPVTIEREGGRCPFKVGDKVLWRFDCPGEPVTVTELTETGFKYTCEPRSVHPLIGVTTGGEVFDWRYYRKVDL